MRLFPAVGGRRDSPRSRTAPPEVGPPRTHHPSPSSSSVGRSGLDPPAPAPLAGQGGFGRPQGKTLRTPNPFTHFCIPFLGSSLNILGQIFSCNVRWIGSLGMEVWYAHPPAPPPAPLAGWGGDHRAPAPLAGHGGFGPPQGLSLRSPNPLIPKYFHPTGVIFL